ncbi:nitrogen regulatory protein otam [Stemphylium lycopersici]|uniref:Nitrogen regulatory protein otam n=1 Tax=Stemphylium lycopersici TaxID=183478 RepID=A0A364NBI1_STELY|nr:nitrogen regulatory protein otam [Stemphylium lycopersici]
MDFNPDVIFQPSTFFPPVASTQNATKPRSRRPCDPCRRRKSRCEVPDIDQPCLLCRFHHQECTFNENPPPRKRRALEINHSPEPSETLPNTLAYSPHSRGNSTTASTSPQNVPVRIRQDPPIDDYANLRGPSLLKTTLGLQTSKHSRLLGATSEYEQLLLVLDSHQIGSGPVATSEQSSLRRVDDTDATTFFSLPDVGTLNHQHDIPDLDAVEIAVAPHGSALIHLYFRIVHPSFPILHKNVFLEKYARTHREFSPPLLAAVYLLALNWWSYSSELASFQKPDVLYLEELALKSFSNIVHRPKLSTIQAGLLLLQRPGGDSWAMTTQLVGLGQDIGLHLDCTEWHIPGWERGLRKRLAWAMYMQDKWGSLVHGRPSHIIPIDWDAQPLNEDDFPENAADEDDEDGSTEVEKGRMLFCYMVELTQILAHILATFYTLKAEREFSRRAHEGVRSLLDAAKPLQLALRQWYADMPPTLKMQDIAARKLSSVGYLHLGYFAVEMTLHRRIIRSLSLADDQELRLICRQAAQTRLTSAMNFVQSLRPEHHQSFWYFASTYNFVLIGSFISLLWVTSDDNEESAGYRTKLDEYKWMLRVSSKSSDFIERALASMNTSTVTLVKNIAEGCDTREIISAHQSRSARRAPEDVVPAVVDSARCAIHEPILAEAGSGDKIRQASLDGIGIDEHLWFQALRESGSDGAYEAQSDGSLGISGYFEMS